MRRCYKLSQTGLLTWTTTYSWEAASSKENLLRLLQKTWLPERVTHLSVPSAVSKNGSYRVRAPPPVTVWRKIGRVLRPSLQELVLSTTDGEIISTHSPAEQVVDLQVEDKPPEQNIGKEEPIPETGWINDSAYNGLVHNKVIHLLL